jgi:PhnB protein
MSPVKQFAPYLVTKGAAAAIDFYVEAFGAVERFRLIDPVDGRVGHAELSFGDHLVMLADEYPDFGALSPDTLGGSPVKLHLDVDDVDAVVERAVRCGATLLRPIREEFYGSRTGMVADPFGYSWFVATKTEDVSPAEMQRRWSASTTV